MAHLTPMLTSDPLGLTNHGCIGRDGLEPKPPGRKSGLEATRGREAPPPRLGRVPDLSRIRETVGDPAASAARGRWLARGAWLLAAAEVVVALRDHVTTRLSEKERRRMVEIVRSSKGRPSNLSDRERKELQGLLAKTEPREMLKTVGRSGFASRFRRRR